MLRNSLFTCANKLKRARRRALRALSRIAHHQNRLTQARGLFSNAARIGKNQVGASHKIMKNYYVKRIN